MRFAVVVLACVGCATPTEPPAFQSRFSIEQLTNEVRVEGLGYTMVFPNVEGEVALPNQLLLNGTTEVFARGGACANETLVGVAVYPAVVAAAGVNAADGGESGIEFLQSGPGVARLRINYDVSYSCETPQNLRGSSTFTFFPSGRIVRHDTVTPLNAAIGPPMGCGCQPGSLTSPIYFTSFYTFAGSFVDSEGDALPAGTSGVQQHCAVAGDHVVGVSWQDSTTRLRQSGNAWASVYDWVANASSLSPMQKTVTSALKIQLDSTVEGCDTALEGLGDPPLEIDGREISTDEHGVFVDDTMHSSTFELTVPIGIKEFALSVDIGDRTHARVTRSTETRPEWYTAQIDGGRVMFWFEDGLDPGETITIEPID
jgi:hypothetical protein